MCAHRHSFRSATIALFVSCLLATTALANDAVMGGRGSNLVPLATTDVVMESEDITLTYVPEADAYDVLARYVFVHPGAQPVSLQIGFPEYRCEFTEPEEQEMCLGGDRFLFDGMQTRVRGELVKQRKGRVSKKHEWAPVLGGVWLFDVGFAPGERVPVEHSYRVPSGYDSMGGRTALYVTRTGALWAKPIGQARFTFVVPARSVDVMEPENVKRTSYRVVTDAAGPPRAQYVYEEKYWRPEADLALYFRPVESIARVASGNANAESTSDEHCVLAPKLRRLVYGEAPDDPLFAQDDVVVTHDALVAELAKLPSAALAQCDAYVLAAYGKPFEDRALYAAFYGDKQALHGPLVAFEPNADFSLALLSEQDLQWQKITAEAIAKQPSAAPAIAPATSAPRQQDALAPAATAARSEPSLFMRVLAFAAVLVTLVGAVLFLFVKRRRR